MSSTPLFAPQGNKAEVEEGNSFQPKFDRDGLVAAIVTDGEAGGILMMAWMDAEALQLTLARSEAHFYSRSRKRLWKKGEESGNVIRIREIRVDCDQDALWLIADVAGNGVACHTGRKSCFYRRLTPLRDGEPLRLLQCKA